MTNEQLEKGNTIYAEMKELIETRDKAKKVYEYVSKFKDSYKPLDSCKFQIGESQTLSFYLHPEIINANDFIEGFIEKCDKLIALKEKEFENL